MARTFAFTGGILYKQGKYKINHLIDQIIARGPRQEKKETLPQLAKEAGLLGGIIRDLNPYHFEPENSQYTTIARSVMGIFNKETYSSIPMELRIKAADALGQAGDLRLMGDSMVQIPGCIFWMGAQKKNKMERNFDEGARDRESPVHQVELSPYSISKYPITVRQ